MELTFEEIRVLFALVSQELYPPQVRMHLPDAILENLEAKLMVEARSKNTQEIMDTIDLPEDD